MTHTTVGVTVGLLALTLASACTAFKRFAYEGLGRDRWQQPDAVIRALDIQPGDRIADIGAGGGYFTFRLADAVGREGTVYAVDIDDDMTKYLRNRAEKDGYHNVDVVLATPTDPGLPTAGVDLIFTCDTYHHFDNPSAYFAQLKGALRPGGRVAIIDYRPEGFWQRLFGHATASNAIENDMRAAGYRVVDNYAFLSRQSFVVFTPDG